MIYLSYSNKASESAILDRPSLFSLGAQSLHLPLLLKGDNLDWLSALYQHKTKLGSIDLIYIDPPYATGQIFTVGENRVATISQSLDDKLAYSDELQGEAFLEFLRVRLIWLRELLSDQGSIYVHIDYKIGHYVKIIMDEVFGKQNFRNDITRIKCNPKNFHRKAYGNVKDMILFYTKTNDYIWNDAREALSEDDLTRLYKKQDASGRFYTTVPIHAPSQTRNGSTGQAWRGILPPEGRHWRCAVNELETLDKAGLIEWSKTGNPRRIIYADDARRKGKKRQDIWDFKDEQTISYPTQKNGDLIASIIETSSNSDSIVLDAFCGSGTTLLESSKLQRAWIGMDISALAIETTQKRLETLQLLKPSYTYLDLEEQFLILGDSGDRVFGTL